MSSHWYPHPQCLLDYLDYIEIVESPCTFQVFPKGNFFLPLDSQPFYVNYSYYGNEDLHLECFYANIYSELRIVNPIAGTDVLALFTSSYCEKRGNDKVSFIDYLNNLKLQSETSGFLE